MRIQLFTLMAATAIALAGAGCEDQPVAAPATPSPAKNTTQATTSTNVGPQVYFVKGIVQEIKPGGRQVTVKHEAVPNYMPAMTMPFDVKDPKELLNVRNGDKISFRMLVTDTEGWIDRIVVLDSTSMGKPPTHETTRLVRDVDILKVGDVVPNYTFTNELGQAITFSKYRGQALALTFIFTRCPFPNFCPRMSDDFSKVSEKMSGMKDGPKNWHLFSLSFDPEFDTPQHLKDFAARYRYNPEKWSYLTGALIDIDAITEQFGLFFSRELGTFQFNHNLRTVVIDTQGRVQKVFIGNDWKPDELADELTKAAGVKPGDPVNSTEARSAQK